MHLKKRSKKKKQLNKKLVDRIKKGALFFTLFFFLLLIFKESLIQIIVIVSFFLIGVWSMKLAVRINFISLDVATPSAILIGFVWGPVWGFLFGFITATVGFLYASRINFVTLVIVFVIALAGLYGGLVNVLGVTEFYTAFTLCCLLRTITGFLVGKFALSQNTFENLVHSAGESIYYVLIISHVCNLVYVIIKTSSSLI